MKPKYRPRFGYYFFPHSRPTGKQMAAPYSVRLAFESHLYLSHDYNTGPSAILHDGKLIPLVSGEKWYN